MGVRRERLDAAIQASNLPANVKSELSRRLAPELVVPAQALDPEVAHRIASSGVSEDAQKALQAMALGVPIFEATQMAGCTDIAPVWRAAEEIGLLDLGMPATLDRKARITALADARIEKKLLDPDADPSLLELNAVSGTATDKLMRAGGDSHQSQTERVAAIVKLLHSQPSVSVTLSVRTPDPAAEAIDVTPEKPSSDA